MPGGDDALLQTIVAHCADPQFNVSALAEKTGRSATFLREYAYAHHGMSMQKLIETVRLECAVNVLATDGKCIDLVRLQAGYHHTKTFRRAFKKRLQLTPQECRELLVGSKKKRIIIKQLRQQLWRRSVDFDLRK